MDEFRPRQLSDIFSENGGQKGLIKDPLVAKQMYDQIEWTRKELGIPDNKKDKFFKKHGGNIVLIGQSDRVVALERALKHDALTGLHNKMEYTFDLRRLVEEIETGSKESFGLIRMDLDNFSWVNDVFEAHAFGDVYLETAGSIMGEAIRSTDTAYRVGGDEFAVLVDGQVTPAVLSDVSDRIHRMSGEKLLSETLQTVLRSDRVIELPDKTKEREGVHALTQLLIGIRSVRDNVDGRRDHFMSHGRGDAFHKKNLLAALDNADLDRFSSLYTRTKSTLAFTDVEWKSYQEEQQRFAAELSELFPCLTTSLSGIVVTKETSLQPKELDKLVDSHVYAIKRLGGNQVSITS